MILNQFDLYFPLFQLYDNDYTTKEIQLKLVWNHFDLKIFITQVQPKDLRTWDCCETNPWSAQSGIQTQDLWTRSPTP